MKASSRDGPPRSVTLLIPGFPADEADTTCLPALQCFVAALARRHDVRVLAFQYPFEERHYVWTDVQVYSAGGRNRTGIFKLVTWARIARELLAAPLPDVIHSFWVGECAVVGTVMSRFLRCRHVITIGGQEIRQSTPYTRLLRLPGGVSRSALVAPSSFAARVAKESLGLRVDSVVPFGLEDEIQGATSIARDVDVLGVGSLIPLKRYDVFLEVASVLVTERPDIRCVLVGDGPERAQLERLVQERGLHANIRLAGSLPRPDVIALMRRSKVLLHPSEFESQGFVFLEALASGMYVVCRDVGAPGRGKKTIRCESPTEMDAAVREILASEMDFAPERVTLARETVDAYEEVYLQSSSLGVTSQRS